MTAIVGIDLIPNDKIIDAFKRSGMNKEQLASQAGFDSRSVYRMLGGAYCQYKRNKKGVRIKYGPYRQGLIKVEHAERLVRAMGLDPVDFGV
jgi:hypothetical protein